MDDVDRLRDAIQDVIFFGGRLSTKPETAEFAAAMGEACKALADLPDRTAARLEALHGPEWKARLRLGLATYDRASKSGGAAEVAGLVEAQDQLLAIGSQPAQPATVADDEPAQAAGKGDGEPLGEMLERFSMAIGADASKIMQIVNSKVRAEDKAKSICEIDATYWAKKSPFWAKLLSVKPAAIRKTAFWKVERPRHFADATSLWKSHNPDTELPKELRQWDDDNDHD